MTTTTTPLAQRFARLGIYKLVNPISRMLGSTSLVRSPNARPHLNNERERWVISAERTTFEFSAGNVEIEDCVAERSILEPPVSLEA